MDNGVLGEDDPGVGCCTTDWRGEEPIVRPAMVFCRVCGAAGGGGWYGLTPRSPGM